MSRLRCGLIAAVVFAASASAHAQESGVLLGVATPHDRLHGEVVRTYWIVGGPRGAEVKAILPGLLVPRAEDFGRIATVTTCEPFTEVDDGGGVVGPHAGDVHCTDAYWIGPGDASPPPDTGVPAPAGSDPTPCAYTSRTIMFASPVAVALSATQGQSESCEPRGWRWFTETSVLSLAGDRAIDLREVFGAAAGAAYERAARIAERELAREFDQPEPWDIFGGPCAVDTANLAAWTIARARGRWRAELFQQRGQGWCTLSAPLDLRLPRRFTGPSRGAVPWQRLGDASDAVSSPDGQWAIRVGNDGLSFVGAGPRAALVRDWRQQRIVMAEWATGRHVARWSRFVAGLPKIPGPEDHRPR